MVLIRESQAWNMSIFAGEKEPKPVSGRVKEIAEFLLSCVMEKIVRTVSYVRMRIASVA